MIQLGTSGYNIGTVLIIDKVWLAKDIAGMIRPRRMGPRQTGKHGPRYIGTMRSNIDKAQNLSHQ